MPTYLWVNYLIQFETDKLGLDGGLSPPNTPVTQSKHQLANKKHSFDSDTVSGYKWNFKIFLRVYNVKFNLFENPDKRTKFRRKSTPYSVLMANRKAVCSSSAQTIKTTQKVVSCIVCMWQVICQRFSYHFHTGSIEMGNLKGKMFKLGKF